VLISRLLVLVYDFGCHEKGCGLLLTGVATVSPL
jgi:hypothetical protein